MFAHCSLEPPDPRALAPDVPAGAAAVVRRAMAREPEGRYRSAAALADALEGLLAGAEPEMPTLVEPPRPTRRRWLLAGAGALACAAGGLAWYLSQDRPAPPGPGPERKDPPAPNDFLERLTQTGELRLEGTPRSVALRMPHWLAVGLSGAGGPGGVTVWDLTTGTVRYRLWPQDQYVAVALSPDGRWLAASGVGGGPKLYDLTRGREQALPAAKDDQTTSTLLFLEGSRVLASGLEPPRGRGTTTLRFWDLEGGTCHDLDGHHTRHIFLAASPDGKELATRSNGDPWFHVWRAATREHRRKVPTGGDRGSAVAWSPDGKLVAAGVGKQVEFYDPGTGRRVGAVVDNMAHVWAIEFAPNGRVITLGRAIRIWDPATGQLVKELQPPDHQAVRMALTPDGRTLLTIGLFQPLMRVHRVSPWCAEPAGGV
jgi:WD40 repeat protein